MSKYDISPASLDSRWERAKNPNRIVKSMQVSVTSSSGSSGGGGGSGGGIIDWVWNNQRLLGFIANPIGAIFAIGLSTAWGYFVTAREYLWNFNWNATDEDLWKGVGAQWATTAGLLGGTLGNLLGYVGCGALITAPILYFNESLAVYVAGEVAKEAWEEFKGNLANLTNTIVNATVRTIITYKFVTARKIIKLGSALLAQIFPDAEKLNKIIQSWGAKGSKPWSFAIALDNAVESIPWEPLRNFVEEGLEEAWEGCVEAGYVAANAVGNFYGQSAIQKKHFNPVGENLTVEIQLDRSQDSPERVILQAPETILRGQMLNVLNNDRLLRGKDIGVLYGTPPQTAIKERRFKPHIYFYFRQKASEKLPDQKSILDMEVSLRLMDKKSEDMTDFVYIDIIANKIKQKFANPVFQIKKGNMPFGYNDPTGALQTTLWVESLAEAKRVVESLLDIVGASPDWKKLKPLSPAEGGVSLIPEKISILGKINEFPVKGRPGTVHFQESYMWLYGYDEPISLIDLTGKRKSPRVTA